MNDDIMMEKCYFKLNEYVNKLVSENEITRNKSNMVIDYYHKTLNNQLKPKQTDIMYYLLLNHPELLSLADIINSQTPTLKFIYTNYAETETTMDKIFDSCKIKTSKYIINIDCNKIIVNIFNKPYTYSDNPKKLANEDYTRSRKEGYLPLEQAKNFAVGMSWYDFDMKESSSFSGMLFPVKQLLQVQKDDEENRAKEGWRPDIEITCRST